MVRINPDFETKGARLTMSGPATQFGVEFDSAVAIVKRALASPQAAWAGLHVYIGTRILEADAIVDNCRQILELAERLQNAVGATAPLIDFGGGLGVPYFDGEPGLDMARLGRGLGALLQERHRRCPGTRYLLETGRYVVAECGHFITKVRRVKRNKGTLWALTSGGTNQFSAHAFMGGMLRRNFPIELVTRTAGGEGRSTVTVCGPLCTPSDIIGAGVSLPPLAAGDVLAVRFAGAYGYSVSPQGFLSHATPAEVLVDEDGFRIARMPFGPAGLVAQQMAQIPEEFTL